MMSDRKLQKIKARLKLTAFCSLLSVILILPSIAAENNNNNNKKPIQTQFPPNPLEIRVRDPLLPRSPKDKRPLTDEEKATLVTALDELNSEAAAKLQAGDEKGAFEIWYRELRLRRYVGLLPEVQGLSRLGGIAWERNMPDDVQFISKRLETIRQKELKAPVELDVLQALATAFEQVRFPESAITVYEQILALKRQQQDRATEEVLLLKIGELSLGSFDYPKAITAYQQLWEFARQKGDRNQQVAYLKQLAFLYTKDSQLPKAIRTKQNLIELYRNEKDFIQIPTIQLDIGTDYEAIGQLEQAAQTYQETYAFAWSIQLYSGAADALRKLIALQVSQKQIENAIAASQVLIQAEQLANNFYGLMNAYDEMGKLYVELENYPQALEAFESGLEVAEQLKYREDYFERKIQQVARERNLRG